MFTKPNILPFATTPFQKDVVYDIKGIFFWNFLWFTLYVYEPNHLNIFGLLGITSIETKSAKFSKFSWRGGGRDNFYSWIKETTFFGHFDCFSFTLMTFYIMSVQIWGRTFWAGGWATCSWRGGWGRCCSTRSNTQTQ